MIILIISPCSGLFRREDIKIQGALSGTLFTTRREISTDINKRHIDKSSPEGTDKRKLILRGDFEKDFKKLRKTTKPKKAKKTIRFDFLAS